MPMPRGLLQQPEPEQPDAPPGYWGQTARNFFPSAGRLVGDLYGMVRHPIQTIGGLLGLGHSLINLVRPGEQGNEELAKAVGEYFADRYGGAENLKNTLRDDPAGLAADVGLLLAGGAGAAAKVGGKTGQLASVVQTALKNPVAQLAVDLPALAVRGSVATARGAGNLARGGASRAGGAIAQGLGIAPGTGHLPIQAAFEAGRGSGFARRATEELTTLRDAMRKKRPADEIDDEIIARARKSLNELGESRRTHYQEGMSEVNASTQRIDLTPIRQQLKSLYDEKRRSDGSFSPNSKEKVRLDEIKNLIDNYESAGFSGHGPAPQPLTTSRDLDLLKRDVDALYTMEGGEANAMSSTMRNTIKDEIIRVDPEYRSIMEGYDAAVTLERELAKDLSLTSNATKQASLRKLIQALRDGVNTNFGGRAQQVQQLDPQLTNLIAGRSLSPAVPTGMARYIPGIGVGAAGMAVAGPKGLAAMLGASPRLIGEGAVLAGQMAGSAPGRALGTASEAAGRAVGPLATGYAYGAGHTARTARPVMAGVDQARRQARPVNTAIQQVQQPDATAVAPQTSRTSEGMTDEAVEAELRRLYPELYN